MGELDIRYSEISDGEYMKRWLADGETRRWYAADSQKALEEDVDNWIGFSKFKASLTGEYKGEVCGVATLFLMPYKKVSHHCSFYMIVGKEYRKRGIGRSLLKNILNLADNYFYFESIDIEIFEGAPITKLLEEFGFETYAYQERYVKDGDRYMARVLYQKFFPKRRFKVWRG